MQFLFKYVKVLFQKMKAAKAKTKNFIPPFSARFLKCDLPFFNIIHEKS